MLFFYQIGASGDGQFGAQFSPGSGGGGGGGSPYTPPSQPITINLSETPYSNPSQPIDVNLAFE